MTRGIPTATVSAVEVQVTKAKTESLLISLAAAAAAAKEKKIKNACEECGLKTKNYGRVAEKKRRWCLVCSKAHNGVLISSLSTNNTGSAKNGKSTKRKSSPGKNGKAKKRGSSVQSSLASSARSSPAGIGVPFSSSALDCPRVLLSSGHGRGGSADRPAAVQTEDGDSESAV